MKQDSFFQKDGGAFDPLWQFDPELHYRPKVYISDFFRLTGYELINVLFPRTEETEEAKWSNELAWTLRLSYGQKAIWFWTTLDSQVTNGAFVQFYYNGYAYY